MLVDAQYAPLIDPRCDDYSEPYALRVISDSCMSEYGMLLPDSRDGRAWASSEDDIAVEGTCQITQMGALTFIIVILVRPPFIVVHSSLHVALHRVVPSSKRGL